MFPYSVAYGSHATASATNVVKIGANEVGTELAQAVEYFVVEMGKEVNEQMKKYTTRLDELERETAVVGALEDTVRLLVAEVAELRAAKQ